MAIDVSVIIVSWNTRDLLRDCLQSIYEQTTEVSFEVYVVDNASQDGSAEMVSAGFPDVRLIRNSDNRGFAAANNQAIEVACGRYVLLLNSDTRILDHAIDKAVAFADQYPKAGVVGCRALNPDNTLQRNCLMFHSLLDLTISLSRLGVLFHRNRFFGRHRMTWWDYDSVREVEVVAGCFMLVRRTALDHVGLLAEDYFMYSEDTDWCWRFHLGGWKVVYTPDAAIIHMRAASSSQCASDMHVYQRKSMLMFLEKKSGKLTRWLANSIFLAACLVKLPVLMVCRFCGGQRAELARQKWPQAVAAMQFHLLGRIPG